MVALPGELYIVRTSAASMSGPLMSMKVIKKASRNPPRLSTHPFFNSCTCQISLLSVYPALAGRQAEYFFVICDSYTLNLFNARFFGLLIVFIYAILSSRKRLGWRLSRPPHLKKIKRA